MIQLVGTVCFKLEKGIEVNPTIYKASVFTEVPETPPRPRSMAPASRNSAGVMSPGVVAGGWGDSPLARALFAYLSSGENQLSFLEGDLISLMGNFRDSSPLSLYYTIPGY